MTLNINLPHSARVIDYLLGGKDNFAVDRAVAAQLAVRFPTVKAAVAECRGFVWRVAAQLAREGIDQFIDVGVGMPTSLCVHQVVQGVIPAARVVYVDNDPIVLAHSRALMTSGPDGLATHVEADVTRPGELLAAVEAEGCLDWGRPVAVLLASTLQFVADGHDPGAVLGVLAGRLPAGGVLVVSHATGEYLTNPAMPAQVRAQVRECAVDDYGLWLRDAGELAGMLDHPRLRLRAPGVQPVSSWYRAVQDGPAPAPDVVSVNAAVADVR